MKRERLGSRLGFILLSAGCAIGCGNVWKFPWMAGEYGGGSFVLVYLLCLVVLCLPIMTMEFALGRASQTSIVKMYQKMEKPGQKWHIHGYASLFGNICLMAFYTVVAGWMIYYFWMFLTGKSADLTFGGMISNPGVNVLFLAIVVVVGFLVLSFNLQGGLERVTKYIMLALFGLLVVLAVRSITLSGAKEGLNFYLLPDFGKINGKVVTPELQGSVLPGITRKSILEIARDWGYDVEERPISIDEVVECAKSGTLEEMWGTGTAAVVSPVGTIAYQDETFVIGDGGIGELTQKLYDELTGIQWGKLPDVRSWVVKVC